MGATEAAETRTHTAAEERRWLFGSAVLDERSLELRVSGAPVELERKPLEVLLHLLRHAGEVVTKDELLAAVWPGRVLSDSALTSCTHKLREALADEQQDIIKTVHGYGYRLVVPVTVEASAATAPPRFDFKPGDSPPLRPLWKLVERLGTGGHGEAWLARHEKTRAPRVFKFAADSATLTSLKREITLSRLLRDSLGERPDLVQVLDWNLEEPPCFIESEYTEGGSLVTWAKAQGGLDKVPLETRLDLAAQIAETLSAAHSVGVLHKDLKPSNVLVEDAVENVGKGLPTYESGVGRHSHAAIPRIKLADFGSGEVVDPRRLEALGITRMGFTQVAAQTSGGTPLYIAPEVISGQPFTIKSDIYALGVMLYQLVVGDLQRPLAPGWEDDVEDEMLRQDIAAAADGHPSQRPAEASALATRLRSLDQRRAQRAAEIAAVVRAEEARLEIVRMRARRVWVRATMGVLALGVVVSVGLLVEANRARNEAAASAATSQAVSEFLTRDLFASVSAERQSVRGLTVKQVLDGAAAQIDKRFAERPLVAAELHASLGTAYGTIFEIATAVRQMKQAIDLYDLHYGNGSEPALELHAQLINLEYALGNLPGALASLESALREGEQRLGTGNPKLLMLKQSSADGYYWLGDWRRAVQLSEEILAAAARDPAGDAAFAARTETRLGINLKLLGELTASESRLHAALDRTIQVMGEDHLRVAAVRGYLADTLVAIGRHAEADSQLQAALSTAKRAVDDRDSIVLNLHLVQARLRLDQDRVAESLQILAQALRDLAQLPGEVVDQSFWFRQVQAEAFQRLGRFADAETVMRQALASAEKTLLPKHPFVPRMRIGLADILRQRGEAAAAQSMLEGVGDALRVALPAGHPYFADLQRVEGLLAREQNQAQKADKALGEALRIYELRYGASHWLTRRARSELAAGMS